MTDAFDPLHPDVVIVGAGISGMRCAQLLVAGGHSVTVLESSTRTGGRLLSVPAPRPDSLTALDLGASWCWPGETRVLALCAQLDVALHEQHLTGDAMYDDPSGAVRVDGNPIDVASFRFTSGADSLTTAIETELASSPRSHLSIESHVHLVETTPQGVTVHATEAGNDVVVRATHVVMAVAPAIAVRTIRFEPALDDALASAAAATPVWMGSTTKAVVSYPTPFWRESGLAGAAVSHRGPLREIHDLSGPFGEPAALFGFGSSVEQPVTEADVIDQMVRLFGPQAATPDEIHITDWRPGIDGLDRLTNYQTYGHRLYQAPWAHGVVHWSSTETGTVNPGHIEGALAAAERVVANIVASTPATT